VRIDRLLYFLRFARSRALAHDMVDEGHIRRNGVRVMRTSQAVAAGDILTFFAGGRVRVIEILALPARRGPAPQARACYRDLDEPGEAA